MMNTIYKIQDFQIVGSFQTLPMGLIIWSSYITYMIFSIIVADNTLLLLIDNHK